MKVGEFPKLLTPVEIEQEIEKTARGKLVLKLITEQWLNDRLGTACDLQEIFEIPLQKTKSHGSLDIGALHPACEAIIKYCDRHRLEIWSKPQSKIKVPAKIKISASDLLNRVTTARQMIFECLDIAQSISADVRKWVCNSAELKSFDPGKLEGLARTLTFYGALIKLRDDSSGAINLHARNIDIEGFDTKFLELNQARLERLYVEDSDRSNSGLSFEAYFGLIDKARRVRMRCLDPKWAGERGAHFFQDGDIEVEKDRIAQQMTFFKAAKAPCIVYGETARSVQGIKSAPLATKPKLTEAETAAYGRKISDFADWCAANGHDLTFIEVMPMGEMGDYHLLAANGVRMGALMRSPAGQEPRWMYYIGVGDIDAAMEQIKAGGGQVLDGPHQIPGGEYSLHARDPQGAAFGLVGPRVAQP